MGAAESFRPLVAARAGGACEYCRLLEGASGVTFHIEHVRAKASGGKTVLTNLALSCPGCNLAKGNRSTAVDLSGTERQLFNPRDYEPASLGWHLHFVLDRQTGRIVARSPVGEATIAALKMNHPQRVYARKLQVDAGLIS
ncbi:MAG: HNH endonuclease [Planctomycetota bacterium]|nr:MAG: HNH endonuclease [Planctomycetota bacterium]